MIDRGRADAPHDEPAEARSTLERLESIVARHAGTRGHTSLVPEAPLTSLGVDSLAMVEIAFDIESEFAFPLDPRRLQPTWTVAQLVRFIERETAARDAGR